MRPVRPPIGLPTLLTFHSLRMGQAGSTGAGRSSNHLECGSAWRCQEVSGRVQGGGES